MDLGETVVVVTEAKLAAVAAHVVAEAASTVRAGGLGAERVAEAPVAVGMDLEAVVERAVAPAEDTVGVSVAAAAA